MADDTSGPAFPSVEQWNEWSDLKAEYVPRTGARGGMTLRAYFAGQALVGLCAHLSLESQEGPIWNPEGVAERAYALADAMIAEGNK